MRLPDRSRAGPLFAVTAHEPELTSYSEYSAALIAPTETLCCTQLTQTSLSVSLPRLLNPSQPVLLLTLRPRGWGSVSTLSSDSLTLFY